MNDARQKWLKERQSCLGGSEISSVLGINPFRSSYDVFISKTMAIEQEDSEQLERGRFLEDGIRRWYEHRTGKKTIVLPPDEVLRMKGNPIIGGTPDCFALDDNYIGGKYLVEIKTVHFTQAYLWGDAGTDALPDYYLAQVLWYLGITETEYAEVAALVGGDDLRIYKVKFDQEAFNIMVEKGTKFWNDHIKRREPPEMDNSEGAKRFLAERFPNSTKKKKKRKATPSVTARIMELKRVDAEMKVLLIDKETIENEVKEFIGNYHGVEGTFGNLTWPVIAGRKSFQGKEALDSLVEQGYITQKIADQVLKSFTKQGKSYRRLGKQFKKK